MAVYPEDPAPKEYEVIPVYSTLITNVGSGNEQRKKQWSFPKYNVRISYDYDELDIDDMQIIWDFYMEQYGSYSGFYVFDQYVKMNHYGQFVGIGDDPGDDSGTSVFNIPGRGTYDVPGDRALYITSISGSTSQRTSNITWGDGTGEGNCDQVTFTSNYPETGEIVTVDFYGYLRMRCRFEQDNLSRRTLLGLAFSMGVPLKGLNPE